MRHAGTYPHDAQLDYFRIADHRPKRREVSAVGILFLGSNRGRWTSVGTLTRPWWS